MAPSQVISLTVGGRKFFAFYWHFNWDVFHPVKMSNAAAQYFVLRQFRRAAELKLHARPPIPPALRLRPDKKQPRTGGWRPPGSPEGAPGKIPLYEGLGVPEDFDPERDPVIGSEWQNDPVVLQELQGKVFQGKQY
jgi:hypothetical protein